MEEERGFLARQKVECRTLIFRAPSRRRWGLVASLGMIYFDLPTKSPRAGPTGLRPLGVLEGIGTLFDPLAGLLPEEQTTLAGILRVWAGIFVTCGFGLMMVGGFLGWGPPGP